MHNPALLRRWCMNKIQINQRVIFIGLMVFDEKQPFFTKNIINKRRNTLIANDFIHAPTPFAYINTYNIHLSFTPFVRTASFPIGKHLDTPFSLKLSVHGFYLRYRLFVSARIQTLIMHHDIRLARQYIIVLEKYKPTSVQTKIGASLALFKAVY